MDAEQFINGLNEEGAMKVCAAIERKFGWCGTFFTRQDAEIYAEGEELDDKNWELIRRSKHWNKVLPEVMVEAGFGYIAMFMHAFEKSRMEQKTI